jgi:hypothetical protein
MSRSSAIRLAAGAAFICIVSSLFVWIFNPWNWGVMQSSRFSWRRFYDVRKGEPVAHVMRELGAPVRISSHVNNATFCSSGRCSTYVFAARRSKWLISYQEAWVIVDAQGRVERIMVNQQP